jgi:tight adherence protein B
MIAGLANERLTLLAVMIILIAVATILIITTMRADDRQKKLSERVRYATSLASRSAEQIEEQLPLTRIVGRSEQIQSQIAGVIGIDLQQAETYPIKWWLVPLFTLGVSWIIAELASHPLGHKAFVLTFGWSVIWLLATKFIFNVFNNRRNAALLEQFPDALNTIVRCVRVGIPMGEALRTVSRDAQEPTKAEFVILADKVSIGIPIDVALRELSARIKLTEYQFFATALTLQARSGGGITQMLEALADVIRKRAGLKHRGYALTAEARTSAMILCVLPFFTSAAIFIMQRSYMMLLFTTASGQDVLALAVLMMSIGIGIIYFMISNVLK